MRWTFRMLAAAALTLCAAAAYAADPPGRVARLSYASGAVSFAPGDAPGDWTQAVVNRPLTGGDRLWADRDGRAEFQVGSTAVRMAPLTNVDVLHLDDDRLQLRLAQGAANVRVRVLDPGDFVEIATPAGAVIIREPGSYRITADPNDEVTRVAVNFGQAEVITPARDLTVPAGQTAVVSAHASPVFEVASAADEFDRWAAERDRRYERVVSTRYVSPYMTGHEDLDHYGSWRTEPEYGAVWVPARVAPDWAPYRHGHWAWISPWGWTWIDDAPWGFAPFHYGRWVRVHNHWAWAPGPIVRRPVYAPALVAFVGGPRWSVSVASGPAVGWFPLGWREPFHPWYRASSRHVHNMNVTHVTHVTNITNVRHVHRHRPEAVTVVSRQDFVSARRVGRARLNVARDDLARAEVVRERQPAQPVRASIAPERRGRRPPEQAATREVVAVNAPAQATAQQVPGLSGRREGGTPAGAEPRVRVIDRDEIRARRAERRDRAEADPRAAVQVDERARAETEQRDRAQAQQRARLEAEQRNRAVAEQRARTQAQNDQRARVEAERVERAEAQQRAGAEVQQRNRGEAERATRRNAQQRDRAETQQRAGAQIEQRNRVEAEQRGRVEAEQRTRIRAERRAQAEAEQRNRAEGEQRARAQADRGRLDAEQRARAQAERRAQFEAEQRARAEVRREAPRAQPQRERARERAAAQPEARIQRQAAPPRAAAAPAPRVQAAPASRGDRGQRPQRENRRIGSGRPTT